MEEEIFRVFPKEVVNYGRYIDKEGKKYNKIIPCLSSPYNSFLDYFRPQFLKAIPHLDAHMSLYDVLSKYYDAEELKLAFTFQAKYIGMSPWEAPGTFSIISYIEHKLGVFHVEGGLNKLSRAMVEVVVEQGGRIYLGQGVKKLLVKGDKVEGIELENGEKRYYDMVVINADFASAMKKLVPEENKKKYSDKNLEAKKYSCSTFMLYLGIDKIYEDISHHSIIFANKYRENVEDIVKNNKLSDDFSFYVQNASPIDKSLAPEGHSTIYVLVPVPNNKACIDWDKIKAEYRDKVLDAMEKRGGYTNIREHIVEEKIITPKDWEEEYDVFKGAVFNLGHQVSQMLTFRPHNKLEILDNCYLAGGGTHPGSGLPTIYESGRISSELIIKKYK
jgi:phytoene desaturase